MFLGSLNSNPPAAWQFWQLAAVNELSSHLIWTFNREKLYIVMFLGSLNSNPPAAWQLWELAAVNQLSSNLTWTFNWEKWYILMFLGSLKSNPASAWQFWQLAAVKQLSSDLTWNPVLDWQFRHLATPIGNGFMFSTFVERVCRYTLSNHWFTLKTYFLPTVKVFLASKIVSWKI